MVIRSRYCKLSYADRGYISWWVHPLAGELQLYGGPDRVRVIEVTPSRSGISEWCWFGFVFERVKER